MPISCYTIGGNSLLMACSELLLERGDDLRGIITSSYQVADWARKHDVAVIDAAGDYSQALHQRPFDYLFSIAHLHIIPEAVLALPHRDAINFHDGILPAYAGLNVPVWALINRESSHGVTWHVMTKEADAGDILKQTKFAISDDETALILNTKCFDAGYRTFGELIEELSDGGPPRIRQDLSQRRYFSRSQRPAAACTLDWRATVEELDALVRSLDFGNYANPVGAATVSKAGRACVVKKLKIVAHHCDSKPGTIVGVSSDQIQVAAGDGVVALEAMAELDGRPIAIGRTVTAMNLQVNGQFDVLADASRDQLTKLNRRLAKSEAFWADRLATVRQIEVLPQLADATGESTTASEAMELAVPEQFLSRFGGDAFAESLSAAFAAYLARLADAERIDLAFENAVDRAETHRLDTWVSARVPTSARIDLSEGFERARYLWRTERKLVAKRGTWLRDLVGRTPELRVKPELRDGRLDLIGVRLVKDLDQPSGEPAGAYPVLVVASGPDRCRLVYDPSHYNGDAVDLFCRRFCEFLTRVASDPNKPLGEITVFTNEEERRVLFDWNSTETPYRQDACIHHLFEEQVVRSPDAEAIAFAGESLTYRELNCRANQLAAHLREMGVGPDRLVGVCVERSIDMVVAILGVVKAGGAYVPLDPSFPTIRIAMMMHDSRAPIVITQSHLVARLPASTASIIRIDAEWPAIAAHPDENVTTSVGPENLAYVIYTSGSTGRPKGVMIEHRNVTNFFAGMDERIEHRAEGGGVWLAVTSLSFDISVLELFWTLARGFKVVLYSERHRPRLDAGSVAASTPMRFSLFYFASDEQERAVEKYRLLIEGAKFADRNGFVAVSTPERHFHAFGGLYPNPAVAGAAIATITKNVQIRAGSVVLPLHHPARVAEEWSLVDNLSYGRVGISFASGWQPVDFVIRPEAYSDRHQRLYDGIETVRKLWRGEAVSFPDAKGQPQAIRTLPRPIQKDLPVWVTTAGSPETWRSAGKIGANVLTHLLGQTIEEVGEKARLYRDAYRDAGHAGTGYVTLMLHTFVGDSLDEVRETVRKPMKGYIGSSLSLVKNVASSWSAYKRRADGSVADADLNLDDLSPEEMDGLLDLSFERYFETSGLFGTPDDCLDIVSQLRGIGVDEIACLIDFGVDSDLVLAHLEHLNRLRQLAEEHVTVVVPEAIPASGEETIGMLIRRHGVTHLQCTPSMASMIVADDEARQSLRPLEVLMIGGEAFPVALSRELRAATDATIINMYGPTETTIWSSTAVVQGNESSISIGRPIANTQLYILDDRRRPTPVGGVGELYIGGDGVVRGYHGRPDLTAERFFDNPFLDQPRAGMYRTGDLARFRSDGTVEFLGRVDHQVKLRGYRIELGEIETAMAEHAGIREAVVLAREDTPGDKRLVGYYVGRSPQPLDEGQLRSLLRDRLPEYMVPSQFVALEQFPQTPNRKVNRKALPAPERQVSASVPPPKSLAPPANEAEAKIAEIWQEVLGISHAGRDDNFFDIGGHSLLAIRAHRRLKEIFDKEITITDLFRFPTVSSFAAFVSEQSDGAALDQSRQRGATRRELMMQRRGARSQRFAGVEDDSSR